jgi:phospholipid/cholesterol/gamma-HCH transport system permease protein
MPILSTLFVLASLAGAYAVGVGQLGVDGGAYITALEQSIEFEVDVVGMLIKAVIFGMTVGLISTYRGYSSEPNAAGVSSATTNAVVQASVATIIFDFFITALWGF